MKFLYRVFALLLMSTLVLESEAGLGGIVRRPRRYNALDCTSRPYPDRASAEPYPKHHWNSCYNYKCFPGCVRESGDTKRICRYGRWTGTDLICKGSCCSVPRSPTGAEVSSSVYPYTDGAVITYRCSEWYTQESGSTTKTCSNGVWTGDDLVCKPYEGPIPVCSEPPSPANTTKKRCSLRSPPQQDDWCRYECSPGYVDIGGYDFRSCSRGVWIGRDLVCVRSCPAPDTDYTAITYCNPPFKVGARCSFYCRYPWYTPVYGSITRTCSNDGTWTGTPLVCRRGSDPSGHDMRHYCIRLLHGPSDDNMDSGPWDDNMDFAPWDEYDNMDSVFQVVP